MKDTIIEYQANTIGSFTSNARITGHKEYEIKDHLGNVRAVISDVKNPNNLASSISSWTFKAEIRNLNSYYPYGMELPGGAYASIGNYGYGYNGMEKDDELKGSGKLYSTLFREGDTENSRWWSRDPKEMKYIFFSPYVMNNNNPIGYRDVDGREGVPTNQNIKTGEYYELDLEPHQWHTTRHGTPINKQEFSDAAAYNTNGKKENYLAYKTIQERMYFYRWAASEISDKGKWFQAASIVNSATSIGAADKHVPNTIFLTDDAEKMLRAVNEYLFPLNMSNFKKIKNNELVERFMTVKGETISFKGLTGIELDYALVEYEQTKIHFFLEDYVESHPGEDYSRINWSMNLRVFFGQAQINKVLYENFNEQNGQEEFDFMNYDHRVKLGKLLIDLLYDESFDSEPGVEQNSSGGKQKIEI